jgi:MFS family permease
MFALVSLALGACTIATSLVSREARWVLFGLAVWSGFFYPGIEVSLFEGLLDAMPADRRPRYVAVNTALANVMAFAAPIAGAALAERIGIPPVMAIGGVSLIVCAALAQRYLKPRPAGVPASGQAPEPCMPPARAEVCVAPDSSV